MSIDAAPAPRISPGISQRISPSARDRHEARLVRERATSRRIKQIRRVVTAAALCAVAFGAWQWLKPFDYFIDREIDAERTIEAIEHLDGHDLREAGLGVDDAHIERDAYVLGAIASEARVEGKRLDLLAISLHLLDHVEDDTDRATLGDYIRTEFKELENEDPPERRHRDLRSTGQFRWSRFLTMAALSAAHDADTASLLASAPDAREWIHMSEELGYVVSVGTWSYDDGFRSLRALWSDGMDLPLYSERPINAALTLERIGRIGPHGRVSITTFDELYGQAASQGTRLDMRAVAIEVIEGFDGEARATFNELIDRHLEQAPTQSSGFTGDRLSIEQRVHEEVLVATLVYARSSAEAAEEVLDWLESPSAERGLGEIRMDDTEMGKEIRSHQQRLTFDHDDWSDVF